MRLVLIAFALTSLIQPSRGQQHSMYGGFGYNLPTTTDLIGSEYSNNGYDLTKGSFADGYNFHIGYSFFLFENIGLDIYYNNLIGFRYKQFFNNGIESNQYDNRASTITPSLLLKQDVGNFSPFIKFGPSINFITLKIGAPNFNYVYNNDYSIGWSTTLGCDVQLSNSLSSFVDIRLNSVTFYPNEISLYRDGTLITVSHPEPRLPANGGVSSMEVVSAFPFSSVGFSVGAKIKL